MYKRQALAQLQALVDAMPFVKLREVTVSQSANQVDVDVQDIKLDQYAYVLFVDVYKRQISGYDPGIAGKIGHVSMPLSRERREPLS